MMNFSETERFQSDLRRLSKKYRSLSGDMAEFKKVVGAVPLGSSKHFAVLHRQNNIYIVKARFFCRYLKGSAMRIIYAYCEAKGSVEFIEIYFKGEKGREDQKMIKKYFASRKAGSPLAETTAA